ncbi:arylamine N-acetyltransferase family protein [Pelagicoccus mobilis]|uniref:Arylamine N-acetyltransferase n=1 Tax=Pelagicoccus mobilis TaxID=415221 RepID=A0A934RXY9_9BACT|nr:arylamine N-acetyltransferase [Pelagicoccus mobilis]MBK1876402.1 arylamine N-acetyltransferase [Pelagicoccus mobilis]
MSETIDLDAYFQRIQFTGTPSTDLETLTELHQLHLAAIPFENLDVLFEREIKLDLNSIQQKLVHNRRGGYCYEQNGLFAAVLRTIGFKVTPRISRVRWQTPEETQTGQTHKVLEVQIGGESYLADVGFGGIGLIEPILLHNDQTQHDAYEPRRIVRQAGVFKHQIYLKECWQEVYHINEAPASSIDYEIANWFTSTHPTSAFKKRLIVCKVENGTRTVLLNRELTIRSQNGLLKTQLVQSPEHLAETLSSHFGLDLSGESPIKCEGIVWD